MVPVLSDYYRLAADSPRYTAIEQNRGKVGFFRLGTKIKCYGHCQSGVGVNVEGSEPFDASKDIRLDGSTIHLPFSFTEVIDNLRRERYEENPVARRKRFVSRGLVRKSYYLMRELLPISIRRHLQRAYLSDWQTRTFPAWPVDFTVDSLHEEFLKLTMRASDVQKVPFIWFWPEGAPACLIMTHDVETSAGRDFTSRLIDIDESYGLKASFQVIPDKRYVFTEEYIKMIQDRGFEFNIHDLNHDGRLYLERGEFLRRAGKINEYVHRYNARGFRAGAMYRMLDWYDAYEFSYDMSVPNVAHLEPCRGGCCTVMPYFVGKIVELPLTTTQDYSLFYILNEHSIDLWKKQLNLIEGRNGLMSFIAHPDYLIDHHNCKVYETLLAYLQELIAHKRIWSPLPRDVDRWWRARSQMELVPRGDGWGIEGPESERARVAYAILDGDRLVYEVTEASPDDGHRA